LTDDRFGGSTSFHDSDYRFLENCENAVTDVTEGERYSGWRVVLTFAMVHLGAVHHQTWASGCDLTAYGSPESGCGDDHHTCKPECHP
jgi:hypothetical protein